MSHINRIPEFGPTEGAQGEAEEEAWCTRSGQAAGFEKWMLESAGDCSQVSWGRDLASLWLKGKRVHAARSGGKGEDEMLKQYPKCEKLHDGTEVLLRLMVKEDQDALFDFFQRVPKDDRLFLREDVSDPATIGTWVDGLNYDRVLPLLGLCDGNVVGDATLHRRQVGWTRHVGKVRLVVDPHYRQKGLGTLLIRELVEIGRGLDLERLVVELMGTQQTALLAFRHLGFERMAVLCGHVKDQAGRPQDLVVMIKDLVEMPEPVSF